MPAENILQIYEANPITTNQSTDLMYFGQSPYGTGNDAAMNFQHFAAQFGGPFTPAALTSTSDTNVTITLGGTPATALLEATSITMGWSGELSLSRGGTNANLIASNGGIFYSTATSGAILSGTVTANQMLQSGASGAPAWSTSTWPATTTINQILYSSANNAVSGITAANNGVLITSNSGVPSLLANSGTPGFVLTANSGAPPSWQSISADGAITTIDGDSGSITPTSGIVTINGGTTGLTTSGLGSTLSLTGTLIPHNGGTGSSTAPTAGQIPIGTSGGVYTPSAISSGTNILVGNSSGAISIGITGVIGPSNGGTGINNGSNTLTLGGNLATSGAFGSTFTMTGTTAVTFPTSGTLATTSQIPTGAALTEVNDTNVTLTLGGSPTTALVNAASITAGWTGTLSPARGGTGVNNGSSTLTLGGNTAFSGAFTFAGTVTGNTAVTFPTSGTLATTSQLPSAAALTVANDTNVTLTLGGTPATALLQASSITAGWTGTLSVGRGGSGAGSFTPYAVLCGGTTSTGAFQSIAGVGSSGQVLTSNGASALPTFQNVSGTGTVNSGTANDLAYYATSTNAVSPLATANNGILVTNGSGVPSIGNTVGAGLTMPSVTFNTTTGVVGTTTNNNAASGSVGEYVSSQVLNSSPISISSGTQKDITSISLTAGDWDVYGNFTCGGSVSTTSGLGWVSLTSATIPDASLYAGILTIPGAGQLGFSTPTLRVSIASTTTVYLTVYSTFSGTGAASGGIEARRRR